MWEIGGAAALVYQGVTCDGIKGDGETQSFPSLWLRENNLEGPVQYRDNLS